MKVAGILFLTSLPKEKVPPGSQPILVREGDGGGPVFPLVLYVAMPIFCAHLDFCYSSDAQWHSPSVIFVAMSSFIHYSGCLWEGDKH